ncbi:hypothetical protein MC7420_7339 [Coleofasciculus chthonoplastes PCC 7420]|uniref:Uncharacterized protein n=1 Tax=Coleofasciculus chthonoplastes PCC 7420 TaxID=118168 RepID=B4VHW8_9CYAN|nr:hypothetical protein MC7420_7339 [Coleofasciculus chthonoplastes PCC 7420]
MLPSALKKHQTPIPHPNQSSQIKISATPPSWVRRYLIEEITI